MTKETFSHFQIGDKLGEGGMGEVYLATDTRLGRQVALKILPDSLADDRKRMARFEREARVLASLNHPNIAGIYGLEKSDGKQVLVMELVTGEDLSDRIRGGAMPLEEALKIALQVANGLEAAHEKSITHRDLKPSNIKITPGGQVKILDFGLAKQSSGLELGRPDSLDTLLPDETAEGVIVGTPAYMSPEQARGAVADRRTDIWAFGVVLYEMLAGRNPFKGDTPSDTLAHVIEKDPEWRELPRQTPLRIRTLIQRCLTKEIDQRLQAIGEARIIIQQYLADPSDTSIEELSALSRWQRILPWRYLAAALALMTALAVALGIAGLQREREDRGSMRLLINRPTDLVSALGLPLLSPDGKQIAFTGLDEQGHQHIWVRRMGTLQAQKLAGTEGVNLPFWSPDSRFLGFFADGKLKKVSSSGGPALVLADAPDRGGGTWSRQDMILFSPEEGPLYKISAEGKGLAPATTLNETRQESGHWAPYFLPDGRLFVYSSLGEHPSINIASLDSAEGRVLLPADTNAAFASSGHILFVQGTTLMAHEFDVDSLELAGSSFAVAEEVGRTAFGRAHFSVSENGVLAYRRGSLQRHLVWWNRAGGQIGTVGKPNRYLQAALSPNGERVAVEFGGDIWLLELASNILSRFTLDPNDDYDAVWSPDGTRLLFQSDRNGRADLFLKPIGGGEEEVLLSSPEDHYPEDWSRDGRLILFENSFGRTLYSLDPEASERIPEILHDSPFSKDEFHISPNGKWIAFGSGQSEQWEIYLAAMPDLSGRRQVSTAGGSQPIWRRDGKELFYLEPDGTLMSVEVDPETMETGVPQLLFRTGISPVNPVLNQYAVTADGQRFLAIEPTEADQIIVVVNWPQELGPGNGSAR